MRSFNHLTTFLLVGAGVASLASGTPSPNPPPEALITPAPSPNTPAQILEELIRRQDPDALSLARVLLTAVPSWLRLIAATNLPAASSILWEEFLDGNRPDWFLDLPDDIQSYLIQQFAPTTVVPTDVPTSAAVLTETTGGTEGVSSAAESSAGEESSGDGNASTPTQTGKSTATRSTESTETPSASVSRPTRSNSLQTSLRTATSASLDLPNAAPTAAPALNPSGLSRAQKVGIGLGVPFAILGATALLLAIYLCLRRRRRKSINGSLPPSSPGFIPRFAFQEKDHQHSDDSENFPLNRASGGTSHTSSSFGDVGHNMAWDEDAREYNHHPPNRAMGVSNDIPTPIMAPALYHTHSSNRARGKRTSRASLHSVTEVTEPESEVESPVLPRQSPAMGMRTSAPRNLLPLEIPGASRIKRKPVASQDGGRPAVQVQGAEERKDTSSPPSPSPYVSPISPHPPTNPFRDPSPSPYTEDFGPEYRTGYDDIDNGLYGGHTSLSRYPASTMPQKQAKPRTEWPLQSGSRQKRTRSPMWDRVYEG